MVRGVDRLSPLAPGQGQQPVRQGSALPLSTGDDQDGVVARDGAQDVALVRVVQSRRQVVGSSRRRAHHDEVGRYPCGDEQLLTLSPQARAHLFGAGGHPGGTVAALTGHGIHQGLALAHLDRAQLDEVARQGCLGDGKTVAGQDLQKLALGPDTLAPENIQDELTSPGPGPGNHEVCSSPSSRVGSAATNDSICALVTISGGASRITSGVGALTMKPALSPRSATTADTSADSSMARSRPAPRTPRLRGWASAATDWTRRLPTAVAARRRASPLPGGQRVPSAPAGPPAPSPLATVMASGMMPACWNANHVPVRPTPVCTSSMMSKVPLAVVSSRASCR